MLEYTIVTLSPNGKRETQVVRGTNLRHYFAEMGGGGMVQVIDGRKRVLWACLIENFVSASAQPVKRATKPNHGPGPQLVPMVGGNRA